ncbi:MAG: hypothetical protein JO289_12530, partial [Xanthobacteraceae bacterium]|nr:hypothetical protein [Xanthobacteraceae bacterium]
MTLVTTVLAVGLRLDGELSSASLRGEDKLVQLRATRQLFDLIHPEGDPKKPRELTWYEYVLVLLQIGASIEHALMVQYLYAAYSLADTEPAKRWRETLLAIAREEMGHLLTVQNILTLLGGPFNLDREEFPWDVP